jgi:hypothetical protein
MSATLIRVVAFEAATACWFCILYWAYLHSNISEFTLGLGIGGLVPFMAMYAAEYMIKASRRRKEETE